MLDAVGIRKPVTPDWGTLGTDTTGLAAGHPERLSVPAHCWRTIFLIGLAPSLTLICCLPYSLEIQLLIVQGLPN